MRSLRYRLQLALAGSILAFSVLFLVLGGYTVRQLGESYVLTRIEHDAEALLAAVVIDPQGKPVLDPERIPLVYRQPHSGHYYVFSWGGSSAETSRSLWDFKLEVPSLEPGARRLLHTPGPTGQTLLLLTQGFRKQERDLVIAVAEDISAVEADIMRYQLWSGVALLSLLAVLLMLQHRLVNRILGLMERVRGEVRSVARGDIERLDEDVPSEVLPLVREVNRLLSLLGQRMERSRHALGNLAHAIKTPLNLLRLESDELESASSRTRLQALTEQIRLLIDRELRRSRLSGGGGHPGQQFDARVELPALIRALIRLHAGKDLDIQAGLLPEASLPLDREDMLELLGNLLDNAAKWARRSVELSMQRDRVVMITVEDDGPGVDDACLQRLTERGVRVDEQVAGDGLGLAIVKDVVELYGGTLTFDHSPSLGGLRVRVSLPLPD